MLNNSAISLGFETGLSALFFVVVSFLLPIFSRELRQNSQVFVAYWFVIFLHQTVAFLNAYLFEARESGTFGSYNDANQGFHEVAQKLSVEGYMWYRGSYLQIPLSLDSFMSKGTFYYEMLATLYRWFGTSLLLGEQFSILAFAFSCIIFLKIIRLLGLERYTAISLICFGALPSVVLHGSVTLREPYEVLFFMLTVYFGMKIALKKKINIYFICLMILSALLMGVFHRALLLYSIFLVFIFLVWSPRPISRFGNIKIQHLIAMVFTTLLIFGLPIALNLFVPCSVDPKDCMLGRLGLNYSLGIDTVIGFRRSIEGLGARSSYAEVLIDSSSLLMTTFSFLKVFSYYLFAPFPWMVSNSMDFYALLESMLRMTLICFSVKHWRNERGEKRRLLGLMLILYFSLSFLWAIGTSNYGTAIRHNIVAWWIISMMGIPQLMATLRRLWLRVGYSGSLEKIFHG